MRFATLAAAATIVATATAQTTFVIPTLPVSSTSTEGGFNTQYPWGLGAAQLRVQYIYDSTHFTLQGITYPIVISNLRWRANGGATQAGGTYSNATIMMSDAAVDQAAPSATFASNHGPNLATVYSGPVTVATGAGTTPNNWYVSVPITPFQYDPMAGDLCIDMMHDGVGPTGTTPALDCWTTGTMCSRVHNPTNYLSPTGTTQANVAIVTELTFTSANPLVANFSANVTGGASPLAVNFTSSSFTSAPGGITSYAWDLNGDSLIDSTAQNPSFVYTNCGAYTVSLTVTDATNPPSTFTRTNYIVTDAVTANFTSQVIGPLLVQLTDTTSPAATAWAWDFNGDTIIDSTAQSPACTFASFASQNVTLTASRLCGAPSTVTRSVSPLLQLTTNLAHNNSLGPPVTIYYDLDVLNPAGVSIYSFDSITPSVSAPFTVEVFLKNGTYVGSQFTAAAWTRVALAISTSNPVANQLSNATFPLPLHIPQGSYGVAMRYLGIAPRYVATTALTTYANGDLSLTLGALSTTPSGPFTPFGLNSPGVWSGTLHYSTNNVTTLAGYGWFGKGCPGTLGLTSVVNTNEPTLGNTLHTNLGNLPFGIALMVVGLSNTLSGGVLPLPLDLGFLGAPGCNLRVSLDVTQTVAGVPPNGSWSLAVPANPALIGFQAYNQAAVLDPAANPFGFVLSHAYGWVVGN
ncbi:MAG TPA: PKD domain-containing protein [Planctomycetota bacterium]|nr:PKD domain-containing protein [Planctomycetota bacterium]